MKILKKILIVVVILFVLLISAAAVLPVIFKDDIVALIKDTANKEVNAIIDFGDFDLSLISSFPNFKFSIQDVSIVGVNEFEGDTLAYIKNLDFKLDLMGVINGNYVVNSFSVNTLVANAIVLEDGKANWDVVPESAEEEEVVETDTSAFVFDLEMYEINNASIVYDDRMEGGMKTEILNLNHKGSLKIDGDLIDLKTNTTIDELSQIMDGIKLINKANIVADADMLLDMEKEIYTFKENQFKINNLKLGLNGWLGFVGEDMDMDLSISALDNRFEDVFSMIPSAYQKDIEGLKTKGEFSLNAAVKGLMTEEKIPAFNVDFSIKDAFVQYPDLPKSIENIQMELKVDNKDGVIDHTIVDLKLLHLEIAKNPIDISYYVTSLETDPNMKGVIKSKLNLADLKDVIPMEEGDNYEGRINADVSFAGKLSSIENEKYELFKAEGQVSLLDLVYETIGMPKTTIKSAYLNFTPQSLNLTSFESIIGKSDISASGSIDNILSYVFKDETIHGDFIVNSNYFNADEWMEDEEITDSTAIEEEDNSIIEIPQNIDFKLTSNFKKIDYDSMPITNFVGTLLVKEGELLFKNNSFELLKSTMKIDGKYSTKDISNPFADITMDIKDLDIPTAFSTFNTIQKLAPIAKNAKGQMSMNFSFYTLLNDTMDPVLSSIDSKGKIYIKELMIENNKLFDAVAKQLNNPKYSKMRAEDMSLYFTIVDGKASVEPFDVKIGGIPTKVSGWTSFEEKIEYTMAMKIPRKDLGGDAVIGSLQNAAAKYGTNFTVGETILVDLMLTGDVNKPTLKLVPRGLDGEKSVKDQAKEEITKKVEETKEKVKEEVTKKVEETKQVVTEKVDETKKKAEEEAARLKKEAEEKAEAEKKKAEEEAKKKAKEALKKSLKF